MFPGALVDVCEGGLGVCLSRTPKIHHDLWGDLGSSCRRGNKWFCDHTPLFWKLLPALPLLPSTSALAKLLLPATFSSIPPWADPVVKLLCWGSVFTLDLCLRMTPAVSVVIGSLIFLSSFLLLLLLPVSSISLPLITSSVRGALSARPAVRMVFGTCSEVASVTTDHRGNTGSERKV